MRSVGASDASSSLATYGDVVLRLAAAVLAAVLMTGVMGAKPAHAADGEIIRSGSNIFGQVHVSSGRLRVNFNHVGDCPTGMNCDVQVRWHFDNLDDANPFWSSGNWTTIPDGQDYHTYCPGRGRYRARMESRLYWSAPATRTVETWGQSEYVVTAGGSAVNRLMAKFFFNVNAGAGYRVGTRMETNTATYDFSPATTVAESGGASLSTNC